MAAELHAGTRAETRKSLDARRRHVRVEVQLEVSFSIAGDTAMTLTRAVTRDISHGGACLAVDGCTDQLLEQLDGLPLLDITISIPPAASDPRRGPALSSFHGRVEWLRHPAAPGAPVLIGLEFCNLDAVAEIAIIDLIAHLLLVNCL